MIAPWTPTPAPFAGNETAPDRAAPAETDPADGQARAGTSVVGKSVTKIDQTLQLSMRELSLDDKIGKERDTPISEAGIVGLAVGAAMTGSRPVVEIMFSDFLTLALEQIAGIVADVERFDVAGI